MCVCVKESEREKSNKMEKRLTMLGSLPLCFPAACQLNHRNTGDTNKSYPRIKTLLPSSPDIKLCFRLPVPDSLHKNFESGSS